jgi:hypothetical protein
MNKNIISFTAIFLGLIFFGVGIYLAVKPEKDDLQTNNNKSVNMTLTSATSTPVDKSINKTVTVPSSVVWYDTGIDIANGSKVEISYRGGHWTNMAGTNRVDGRGKTGFDGRKLLIVPSSQLAALVAKVGSNSFHVGNSYSGKPGSGRLYLSQNDIPKTFDDNEGELDVLVEIR